MTGWMRHFRTYVSIEGVLYVIFMCDGGSSETNALRHASVKIELGCTGNMLFNEIFVTDLY